MRSVVIVVALAVVAIVGGIVWTGSSAESSGTKSEAPSKSASPAVPASNSAPAQVETTEFGEVFPGGGFKNLNPNFGGESIQLSDSIGKMPIALFYWIPGNARADEMLQEVIQLVADEGDNKVRLYAVVLQRPGRGNVVGEGIQRLGLTVPVLDDEGFQLGQRLRVQTVPNVTLIDKSGRLRLTNGASLLQDLEYKLTLKDAILRLADSGEITTYGYLPRYFPATELVGKACPDFKAPLISNSVEQRWSNLLSDKKLNVLVFWSVDCPHCRQSLPEISDWLRSNNEGLNVISAAKVTSDEGRKKTKEFCDLNNFAFETFVDRDLQISKLYNVTSTPTFVIIRPDGVVDSVLLSGGKNLEQTLEQKKRQILGDRKS